MNPLHISSTVFNDNESIPRKYTCDGENINPSLSFSGIPEETKSLALIIDDPDAPVKTWVHWIIFDIPPQFDQIPEGSPPPSSIQGLNDFGNNSYGGPCPPSGQEHRYFFKLYALDTILELSSGTTKATLEAAMEGHIIAQTSLVGKYSRG